MSNTPRHSSSTKEVVRPMGTFRVVERRIENPHHFQLYLMYGTEPGPWVRFGFNDIEYGVGFLPPERENRRAAKPRLKPVPVTS